MIDGTAQAVFEPIELRLEKHRNDLTAYCRRILSSSAGADADDAVQETFLRAWRSADSFEGRAAVRTWLYQIATNVCIDMMRRAARHETDPSLPDLRAVTPDGDPAETLEMRESVRSAFVAALHHLPPQQRAVLILRDVLGWRAKEAADLLGTTAAGVNSALQRARSTLAKADISREPEPVDDLQEHLLSLHLEAFEHYDMDALTSLLRRRRDRHLSLVGTD